MHAYERIGCIGVWNHWSFGGGRLILEEFGGEGGGHLWDHALIGSVKSLNRNHMGKQQISKSTSLFHLKSIFIINTIFILKTIVIQKDFVCITMPKKKIAHLSLNTYLVALCKVNYKKSVTVRKMFKNSLKLDQAEFCNFFCFKMTTKWS